MQSKYMLYFFKNIQPISIKNIATNDTNYCVLPVPEFNSTSYQHALPVKK